MPDFDLLRCATSIVGEHYRPRRLVGIDNIGPGIAEKDQSLTRSTRSSLHWGQLMVDEVGSASFEHTESLIASLATTHDTCPRPWPSTVPGPVIGSSLADAHSTARHESRSARPNPSTQTIRITT